MTTFDELEARVMYDLDATDDLDELVALLADPESRWYARTRLASLAVKGLVADAWNPLLHPRGRDGRFIKVWGWIRWLDMDDNNKVRWYRGQVTNIDPMTGTAHVVSDGLSVNLTSGVLKNSVYTAPTPKASLALPDPKAHIDAPGFFQTGNQGGSNPGAMFTLNDSMGDDGQWIQSMMHLPKELQEKYAIGSEKHFPPAGGKPWAATKVGWSTGHQKILIGEKGNLMLVDKASSGYLGDPSTWPQFRDVHGDSHQLTPDDLGGEWRELTHSGKATELWGELVEQAALLQGGQKVYVKTAKSAKHARNEVLANRLYELAGTNVAETFIGQDGVTLGSRLIPFNLSKNNIGDNLHDEEVMSLMRSDMVIDAWLANWDVVGMGKENTQVVDGYPYRIDAGGALMYRAKGNPKGHLFGPEVGELESLKSFSMNEHSAEVFGKVTDAELKDGATRLAAINPETIKEYADAADLGPDLGDTLVARRAYILNKLGVEDPYVEEAFVPDDTPIHIIEPEKMAKLIETYEDGDPEILALIEDEAKIETAIDVDAQMGKMPWYKDLPMYGKTPETMVSGEWFILPSGQVGVISKVAGAGWAGDVELTVTLPLENGGSQSKLYGGQYGAPFDEITPIYKLDTDDALTQKTLDKWLQTMGWPTKVTATEVNPDDAYDQALSDDSEALATQAGLSTAVSWLQQMTNSSQMNWGSAQPEIGTFILRHGRLAQMVTEGKAVYMDSTGGDTWDVPMGSSAYMFIEPGNDDFVSDYIAGIKDLESAVIENLLTQPVGEWVTNSPDKPASATIVYMPEANGTVNGSVKWAMEQPGSWVTANGSVYLVTEDGFFDPIVGEILAPDLAQQVFLYGLVNVLDDNEFNRDLLRAYFDKNPGHLPIPSLYDEGPAPVADLSILTPTPSIDTIPEIVPSAPSFEPMVDFTPMEPQTTPPSMTPVPYPDNAFVNGSLSLGETYSFDGSDSIEVVKATFESLVGKVVLIHRDDHSVNEDGKLIADPYSSSRDVIGIVELSPEGSSAHLRVRKEDGTLESFKAPDTPGYMTVLEDKKVSVINDVTSDDLKVAKPPTLKADGTIVRHGQVIGEWQSKSNPYYWGSQYVYNYTIFGNYTLQGVAVVGEAHSKNDVRDIVRAYLIPNWPPAPTTKAKKTSKAVAKIDKMVAEPITTAVGSTYVDGTTEAKMGDWIKSTKGGQGFVGKIVGWPDQTTHPGLVFAVSNEGVQKIAKLATYKKVDKPEGEPTITLEGVPTAYEDIKFGDGKVPKVGQKVIAGKPGGTQVEGIVNHLNTKQGFVYILKDDGTLTSKTFSVTKVLEEPNLIWDLDAAQATAAILVTDIDKKPKKPKAGKIGYPGPDGATIVQSQDVTDGWLDAHPSRKTTKDGFVPQVGMIVRTKNGDQAVVAEMANEWASNPNSVTLIKTFPGKFDKWSDKSVVKTTVSTIQVDHEAELTGANGQSVVGISGITNVIPSTIGTAEFAVGSSVYRWEGVIGHTYKEGKSRPVTDWYYAVISPSGQVQVVRQYNGGDPYTQNSNIKGLLKDSPPKKMEKVAVITGEGPELQIQPFIWAGNSPATKESSATFHTSDTTWMVGSKQPEPGAIPPLVPTPVAAPEIVTPPASDFGVSGKPQEPTEIPSHVIITAKQGGAGWLGTASIHHNDGTFSAQNTNYMPSEAAAIEAAKQLVIEDPEYFKADPEPAPLGMDLKNPGQLMAGDYFIADGKLWLSQVSTGAFGTTTVVVTDVATSEDIDPDDFWSGKSMDAVYPSTTDFDVASTWLASQQTLDDVVDAPVVDVPANNNPMETAAVDALDLEGPPPPPKVAVPAGNLIPPPNPEPDAPASATTVYPPLPVATGTGSDNLKQKPPVLASTKAMNVAEAAEKMLSLKDSTDPNTGSFYGIGDSDLVEDMAFRHNIQTINGKDYIVTRFRLREDQTEGLAETVMSPGITTGLGAWKLKGMVFPTDLKEGDQVNMRVSGHTSLLKPGLPGSDEPNATVAGPPKLIGMSTVNTEYELYRVPVQMVDGSIGEVDLEMRPTGSIHTFEYDHKAIPKGSYTTLGLSPVAQQAGWVHDGNMKVPGQEGSDHTDAAGKVSFQGFVHPMAKGSGGAHMTRTLDNGTKIEWNTAHPTESGTGVDTTRRAIVSGEVRILTPADNPPDEVLKALSLAMEHVGIPVEKQEAPSNETLVKYALQKMVSNYHPTYDYRGNQITGVDDPLVTQTMSHITKTLGLDPPMTLEDVRLHTYDSGRVAAVLSPRIGLAMAKKQGNKTYSHFGWSDSAAHRMFASPHTGTKATDERWSLGVMATGLSSHTDMLVGSGDRIYMRGVANTSMSNGHVIMNASVINTSTEAYVNRFHDVGVSYSGGTKNDNFGRRGIQNHFLTSGGGPEVMVKREINVEQIAFYITHNPQPIIDRIKAKGVTHIAGRPIEEIIVTSEQAKKLWKPDLGLDVYENDVTLVDLLGAAASAPAAVAP